MTGEFTAKRLNPKYSNVNSAIGQLKESTFWAFTKEVFMKAKKMKCVPCAANVLRTNKFCKIISKGFMKAEKIKNANSVGKNFQEN